MAANCRRHAFARHTLHLAVITATTAATAFGSLAQAEIPSTPNRPQLSATEAKNHTPLKYLAQGGTLGALVTDNWNPTAGVGSVSSKKPFATIAADGSGTHATVQEAVNAAVLQGGTTRLYLRVKPGTYREVVCIPAAAPPITLYSTDSNAAKTVIVYNNANPTPKPVGSSANPCNANLSGATFGTSGSATFAVNAGHFQAKNLTFANDYVEGTYGTTSQQGVALMLNGDRNEFENVRVLGHQDTLYVKSANINTVARSYFKHSYVEGDVDFIFGRGTAVFESTRIRHLGNRQVSGIGLAPSTDPRNQYGFLFVTSTFDTDTLTTPNGSYLGRAWDEGVASLAVYNNGVSPNGQLVIRESNIGKHVRVAEPWGPSTARRPYSSVEGPYSANRFFEFNNTGLGSGAQ